MAANTTALTHEDKQTLRTAAQGVVVLMAAANPGPVSSTKSGMAAGKALASATGLTGHVLAEKATDLKLSGKNTAEIVDIVFAAIAASVRLLQAKAPDEVGNFRGTITMIADAALRSHRGEPLPAEAEMARKIRQALNAD